MDRMTPFELMAAWLRADVKVLSDGDKLHIRGPRSAEPLVQEIIARKAEVITMLYPSTAELLATARELGFPPASGARVKVAGSEQAWTTAANHVPPKERLRLHDDLERIEVERQERA